MGQENGGERGGGGERKCGDGSRRRVGREVESLRIGGRRDGRHSSVCCVCCCGRFLCHSWLELAARAGFSLGQFMVHFCQQQQMPCPQDTNLATFWFNPKLLQPHHPPILYLTCEYVMQLRTSATATKLRHLISHHQGFSGPELKGTPDNRCEHLISLIKGQKPRTAVLSRHLTVSATNPTPPGLGGRHTVPHIYKDEGRHRETTALKR